MKNRHLYLYIYILLVLISPALKSQTGKTETVLFRLFEGIMQTSSPDTRIRLNDSLAAIIDSYVRSDSVFAHRFTGLRNLGQIVSQDSKVKLVTWNLVLPDGSNKYFLYIISRDGNKRTPPVVSRLEGENLTRKPDTMKVYNADDWYGALYYDIKTFRSQGRKYYLILGLDFGVSRFNRKIIDILSFDGNKQPNFGYLCFSRDGKLKSREVIEYNNEGVVSLRMNSAREIIFDHVVAYSAGHEGLADSYGAGLSFDSYSLKRGLWHFRVNVDIRNSRSK